LNKEVRNLKKANSLMIDKPDSEFYIELQNVDNKYYSIPFKFGSNQQPINLVVDTMTDWTIVQAADCVNCIQDAQRYNRDSSTSYKKSAIPISTFPFATGTLNGKSSSDICCLKTNWGKDVCVK